MRPAFWAIKIVLWLVAILLVIILFVIPLLTAFAVSSSESLPLGYSKYFRMIEVTQTWAMRFLAVAWFYFFGSCFASFLNVVAWRIPRGRSILGSSHCPNCDTKLTFRDNIPVIGWLKNNGQCRTCEQPISIRYLLVELFLGAVFLGLVLMMLWGGGLNIPLRERNNIVGFERSLFEPRWDLIQMLSYFLTLICLLFTFALIRGERKAIPNSISLFGIGLGFALPFIWPAMHVASFRFDQMVPAEMIRFSFDQVITLVAGFGLGYILGSFADRFHPSKSGPETMAVSIGLVGLFLGYQSAVAVTILWTLFTIARLAAKRSDLDSDQGRSARDLFLATIVHLATWRLGSHLGFWPSPTSSAFEMGIAIAVCMALLGLVRQLGTNRRSVVESEESPVSSF